MMAIAWRFESMPNHDAGMLLVPVPGAEAGLRAGHRMKPVPRPDVDAPP